MGLLENHKYVGVGNIVGMLNRNLKHHNWDKNDVIEWTFECVTDEIGNFNSFEHVKGLKVKVRQGRAQLPCGVYRLLTIRNNGVRVNDHTDDGTYLHMSFRTGEITIDYIGIPTIDGYPVVDMQSRQCCYWYCVKKQLFPAYISNDINERQWADIKGEFNDALIEARGSFRNVTRDDLDRLQEAAYTFVKTPAMSRTLHNNGRDDSQHFY